VVKDYPDSPFFQEAKKRLEQLQPNNERKKEN
jgi:outer membrane protein assembly factor BamD (BamD/ComL family)